MEKDKKPVICWEYFECSNITCPTRQTDDFKCWLVSGTNCHNEIQGTWIEKMEACLECPVYEKNFDFKDWKSTLSLISEQFNNYKKRTEEDREILKEREKKLLDFKTTSSYLLKELDKKSLEVKAERNNLEVKVAERTKELEQLHFKMIRTSKMATVGRFSAGIAHEINNPLGAVLYYARKVLADSELKKKNRENLELTLTGLIRIENIVRQILSYTRFSKTDIRASDVNKILKDAIAFIPYKQNKKKIILKLAETTLPSVIINSQQIQQVFINIINNSIDSFETAGKLEIETSYKNEMVCVCFRDNGKGMAQDVLEKVFDPFFTTKDVGEGTGLGLFICYNILQLYDGKIDIRSNKGEGTEVSVLLPAPSEKQ
jgi:two-component system, NtrC family, sensor kinase